MLNFDSNANVVIKCEQAFSIYATHKSSEGARDSVCINVNPPTLPYID